MQLTKFTKTLNGITPSLAVVPAVALSPLRVARARARARPFAPPRPASTERPFTLFQRQGGRVNYRQRQETGETVARYLVVDARRWLRKSAMRTVGERRGVVGDAGVPEAGSGWKGSVCAEEGCY